MSGGDWKEMYGAAIDGDVALLRYHLDKGVDPNFQHPEFQCTALVGALLAGQLETSHALLAGGADPRLLSEFDALTPAQAAWCSGNPELRQLLARHGIPADEGADAAPPNAEKFGLRALWRWWRTM
ncbi:MAG TPA: ankyrin repeat domain-containing protein [Roseateles sp.]|nr:ankyrin repeat domain-containing protein [Roseateles sp.]